MKEKVVDRIDFVVEYVTGKRVLHLGCIDHDLFDEKRTKGLWLHHEITKVASKVIGLDILEEPLAQLRKEGFDIRYADVEHLENIAIAETFDVILAGELVEHLFNIGLFLKGVRKFFSVPTRMVITTPNPFSIRRLFNTWRDNENYGRDDHVCWYSKRTLTNLLRMNNLEIEEILFYSSSLKFTGVRPALRKLLYKRSPRFADGLIFLVRLPQTKPLL